MEGVNVCACTSHMTLGINARVPQHGITFNCALTYALGFIEGDFGSEISSEDAQGKIQLIQFMILTSLILKIKMKMSYRKIYKINKELSECPEFDNFFERKGSSRSEELSDVLSFRSLISSLTIFHIFTSYFIYLFICTEKKSGFYYFRFYCFVKVLKIISRSNGAQRNLFKNVIPEY
ncbi:hypothetical protein BpHYR1_004786 [Brachionus plicatilis]|uniref:Uncharacterized protein n=1 Tax=Brachionus plicatilis TaxID=10195 RepID=A0A3M7RE13_BRAPC|nr:hypothetical protein BpHYR1_004786 [Brachionus plicatilis]